MTRIVAVLLGLVLGCSTNDYSSPREARYVVTCKVGEIVLVDSAVDAWTGRVGTTWYSMHHGRREASVGTPCIISPL